MSDLMQQLKEEFGDSISEFADQYVAAANIIPLSVIDLASVFGTEAEIARLNEWIAEMEQATGDAEKQVTIIEKFGDVVRKLLKAGRTLPFFK